MSVKQLEFRCDAELLGISSGSKLFAYGTLVVLGGLRVNSSTLTTAAIYLQFVISLNALGQTPTMSQLEKTI